MEEEEEEEEGLLTTYECRSVGGGGGEGLFKADAVNEEHPERDRATPGGEGSLRHALPASTG